MSGPAFIPARTPRYLGGRVPEGYVYRPATDHTMAGWVRKHGPRLSRSERIAVTDRGPPETNAGGRHDDP